MSPFSITYAPVDDDDDGGQGALFEGHSISIIGIRIITSGIIN